MKDFAAIAQSGRPPADLWGVRRLGDFHEVTLMLDGHRAAAIAIATAGQRAWLEPRNAAQLVLAALPATARLAFTRDDATVLLTGRAELDPSGCIVFDAGDAFVPNLRTDARLAIELPVTITVALGATPTVLRTTTVDLGRGGLRAAIPFVGPVGTEVDVTIEMPEQLADVTTHARVARNGPQGAGLAFLGLDPAEGDRLESIVLSVRRRFAQRQIQNAARARRYRSLRTVRSA